MKEMWITLYKEEFLLDFLYSYHITECIVLHSMQTKFLAFNAQIKKKNPQARCYQSDY